MRAAETAQIGICDSFLRTHKLDFVLAVVAKREPSARQPEASNCRLFESQIGIQIDRVHTCIPAPACVEFRRVAPLGYRL